MAHHDDYAVVRTIIEHISTNWRERPELDELARVAGLSPAALQRSFVRWAGLTPKAFLQAVTLDHARRLLDDGLPLLDASLELGLSSPARLHDLFVTHEAMSPGAYKARGAGLTIRYGYHASPFGTALVLATDRGLAGISFADDDQMQTGRHAGERQLFDRRLALDDMMKRWPNASYVEDDAFTAPYARRVFDPSTWNVDQPLRVVLIGTDFQIRVWEGLLGIPFGKGTTYSDLAQTIGAPGAARAVGAAVGRNPVSFVVPCHRVIGKSGALTGYHWGLTRKRAMLGWEAAQAG